MEVKITRESLIEEAVIVGKRVLMVLLYININKTNTKFYMEKET